VSLPETRWRRLVTEACAAARVAPEVFSSRHHLPAHGLARARQRVYVAMAPHCTLRDIADATGVPYAAVRSALTRAGVRALARRVPDARLPPMTVRREAVVARLEPMPPRPPTQAEVLKAWDEDDEDWRLISDVLRESGAVRDGADEDEQDRDAA